MGDYLQQRDAEVLRIAAFPDDSKLRRIDWFGPIAFPDRSVRHSQPSLQVQLSEVTDPSVLADYDQPVNPDTTDPNPISCSVSVGTLVLLRIGDLWAGQRFVHRPALLRERFEDVNISDATVSVKAAGSNLSVPSPSGPVVRVAHLLPFNLHPWHSRHTTSLGVLIRLPDGRNIYIHALELIRFYFGSSAALLAELFGTALQPSALYERRNFFGSPPQLLWLELAVNMPGASATDIARIAASPTAWGAARYIGATCLRRSVAREPVYPGAKFPFTGKTTLEAHGIWIPERDQIPAVFVVSRLTSCSHPLPFHGLRYVIHPDTESRRRSRTSNRSEGAEGNRARRRAKPAGEGARGDALVDQEPGASLSPARYVFARERCFTDLENKRVTGSKAVPPQGGSGFGSPSVEDRSGAHGVPSSSRPVRAISLEEVLAGAPRPFLVPLLQALITIPGAEVHPVTYRGADGWTLTLRELPDEFLLAGSTPPRTPELTQVQEADVRVAAIAVRDGCNHGIVVVAIEDPLGYYVRFDWTQVDMLQVYLAIYNELCEYKAILDRAQTPTRLGEDWQPQSEAAPRAVDAGALAHWIAWGCLPDQPDTVGPVLFGDRVLPINERQP